MNMNKKGDVYDWLVPTMFYLILIFVLAGIVYLLITGKFTSLMQGIFQKMRFG